MKKGKALDQSENGAKKINNLKSIVIEIVFGVNIRKN